MAENKEFISAADLPVTEGDEVSVLCLENGEMKQKPGASLGGGGGVYIMDGSMFEFTDEGPIYCHSVEELVEAIDAGKTVVIKLPAEAMGEGTNPFVANVLSWELVGDEGQPRLLGYFIPAPFTSDILRFEVPDAPIPAIFQE